MPHVNIYIHIVFPTKHRRPILDKDKRLLVFQHILRHCKEKDIIIDTIGGYTDHVHILIKLKPTQCLCEIIKTIKGGSSWWANTYNVLEESLYWARSYFSESVNHYALRNVRKYILQQEEHHQKMTTDKEFELLGKRWVKANNS